MRSIHRRSVDGPGSSRTWMTAGSKFKSRSALTVGQREIAADIKEFAAAVVGRDMAVPDLRDQCAERDRPGRKIAPDAKGLAPREQKAPAP